MPKYDWICLVCEAANKMGAESCAQCGNPAVLSGKDIARLQERMPAVDSPSPRRKSVSFALALVAAASVLNWLIGDFLGSTAFNVGRVIVCLFGGWFVVTRAQAGLLVAAAAGVLMLVVDHVLLKGGFFLIADHFWPAVTSGQGLEAFEGVLLSFVMFAPIAAMVSLSGGLFARWRATHVATNA